MREKLREQSRLSGIIIRREPHWWTRRKVAAQGFVAAFYDLDVPKGASL